CRGQEPVRRGGAVSGGSVAADNLPEIVPADDPVDGILAGRGEADFLAELALAVGLLRLGENGQGGVVAVVRRVPVPPAIGGNGREGYAVQVPVELAGHAVSIHVRLVVAVGIPDAGKGAEGDRRVPGPLRPDEEAL